MRFDRPEVWTLAAVFAIASLGLAFGRIAGEMLGRHWNRNGSYQRRRTAWNR